jgi:hypothetical protein
MAKKITGTVLFLGGSLLAYKTWNNKKETKQEMSETRGGTIPYKTMGLLAALGGLFLIFGKNK